jgi:RimJ/RimL family protein N-acetyltransferase
MISIKHITTASEAIILGALRNECLEWMTGSQEYVDVKAQVVWWKTAVSAKGWIWYDNDYSSSFAMPFGFGYIIWRDGTPWVTGGLIESYRGRGHGYAIFKFLLEQFPNAKYKLKVFKLNTPARKIYDKLGFHTIDDDGKVLTMST